MIESHRCRVCELVVRTRTMTISLPGDRVEEIHLCEACWQLLECGFRRTSPDAELEEILDGPGDRVTEPQLRSLIEAGRQADADLPVTPEARHGLDRQRLVRGELRELDAYLKDATATSARSDWTGTLEAVRMIHGRAVITRRALEGMLGSHPVAADLPPLVRAVQEVGRLITDREIDSLRPDELRDRMHAVLRVLDHELQAFLQPPEEESAPANTDRDAGHNGA
jgi:hypothetical protein